MSGVPPGSFLALYRRLHACCSPFRTRWRSHAWAAVAAIALLCSCSSSHQSTPPTGDTVDFELFPTTKMLGDADLADLATDDGAGILTFSRSPASLSDVHTGSVLVAPLSPTTPHGLLRVVTHVQRDGDQLVLTTLNAPVQLAFRKLHVRAAVRSTGDLGAASWGSGKALRSEATASASKDIDFVVFDGDGDSATTNDRVAIHGTLGGGFDYDFSLDVDWGAITELPAAVASCVESLANIFEGELPSCRLEDLLPEVKVSFDVDPFIEAQATLSGAAMLEYEKEFDLASLDLTPIPIGPLVFVPSVDITAKVEGEASAQFSTTIRGSAHFSSGVAVSSKHPESPDIRLPQLDSTDFSADGVKVALYARGKVGVGARLNLLLYSIVGPYAEARAYGEVRAAPLENPCWDIHVGIEAELGFKVAPRLPVLGEVSLIDWRSPTFNPVDELIDSGSCTVPDEVPPAPGAGPGASAIGTPTFTPWSRLVHSPVEQRIVTEMNDQWTDLVRTIDGRFAVAGSEFDTLLKLDDTGDVTWARRYGDPDPSSSDRLLRTIATADTSMMLLSEDFYEIGLAKVAQEGGALLERRYQFGTDPGDCRPIPVGLVRDNTTGFLIVGECSLSDRFFLMHVDENGELLDASTYADPATTGIRPKFITRSGQDVVVVGSVSRPVLVEAFVARFDGNGAFRSTKSYQACADFGHVYPRTVIAADQGDIVFAGTAGGEAQSIVARIRADESVGFAAFPKAQNDDVGSILAISSLQELSITGYVVAGLSLDILAPEDSLARTQSVFLAGLDGIGRPRWARRYALQGDGGYWTTGNASMHLTDDGGVLVIAQAQPPTQGRGDLWAFKAFARDGTIGFDPGMADNSELPLYNMTCTLTPMSMTLAAETIGASVVPVDTATVDAPVISDRLTP